jgi:predicted dehydrogenase
VGVIGLGNMGTQHARMLAAMDGVRLVAVCDVAPGRAETVAREIGWDATRALSDVERLWDLADLDAVVIATPHYDHVPLGIAALERGKHILVEKPIAVHAAAARRLVDGIAAARERFPGIVASAMFNQRSWGHWRTIRRMITDGSLGRLVRATWIITDWFRTQHYYDIGGWRATWAGEGGGALLNQCPHNLDLYQWFFGMPSRIRGFAGIARYHAIEVEDEVTAYFEHGDGMVGHFITSTGESPGTNRLEIVGEMGKLVFEDGALTFWRNARSMLEEIRESEKAFTIVDHEREAVAFDWDGSGGHREILENWVAAIRDGQPLIAPAEEGINSVILANGIMQSSFDGASVTLPLDEGRYAAHLKKLIAESTFRKPSASGAGGSARGSDDFGSSF